MDDVEGRWVRWEGYPPLSAGGRGGRDGSRGQASAQPSPAHFPSPSGGLYCSWSRKFPAPRARYPSMLSNRYSVKSIVISVSDMSFSRDLPLFSRDFTHVHWNIPSSSPIRIFIFGRRYVPILKQFLQFCFKSEFRRRKTAGRPRDRALTQNFIEIRILTDRRGLRPAVLCRAGPSQNGRFFSRKS